MKGRCTVTDLRKRRELEVARQKRRNMRDMIQTLGVIFCLVLWAICMMGFVNAVVGD